MKREGLTIGLLVLCFGCGNGRSAVESPSLQAARLIDDDRTEEAIALLEPEVAKNPEDIEARLTLTTAFAKSAGIDFKRLQPLYERAQQYQSHLKLIADDFRTVNPGTPNELEKKIEAIARLNTYLSATSEFFMLLPRVDESQANLLTHAVHILEEGGKTRRPSDYLYGALLRTILVRDLIVTKLFGEVKTIPRQLTTKPLRRGLPTNLTPNPDFANCSVELDKVTSHLKRVTEHVVKGSQELAEALPQASKEILETGDAIALSFSILTTGTGSLMIADDAAAYLVQENLIEKGLGHWIRCNEGDAEPAPSAMPMASAR